MTNEEKREYLNLKIAYQSTPFIAELSKRNEYINKTPKVLYKYRDFDKFTFDMIENDYVYLTPSGMLDDHIGLLSLFVVKEQIPIVSLDCINTLNKIFTAPSSVIAAIVF